MAPLLATSVGVPDPATARFDVGDQVFDLDLKKGMSQKGPEVVRQAQSPQAIVPLETVQ
jgi:hypothetical protein